ncbi:MAG TPA: hypothetical protein VGA55_08105, partial [Bacteroidota bacterium]
DTLTLTATNSVGVASVPDSFIAWTTVALGRSGSFETWGIVRFDGFSEALANITVKTAEIHLRAFYHLGDSSGQISVATRKVLKNWRSFDLTHRTIQEPGFFENPPRGFTDLGSIGDTADIVIPLDTALVNTWFRSDTTNPNYGIILEPTNMRVIKGFLTPELYLIYTLPDSVEADTSTVVAVSGDYGFVAGASDTTFLADSATINVRSGAAYRGIVSFDTSALPDFSAVHRALLEVSAVIPQSDFSSSVRDSLLALFVDKLGFIEALESLSEVNTGTGTKTYTFNVTNMVQFWVQGLGVPRLGIRTFNERNAVDGFTLYGSAAADTTLRPRLSIIYSTTRP